MFVLEIIVTSLNCHERCKGQCYGTGYDECCDEECTGGCSGPSSKDCWVIQFQLFGYLGQRGQVFTRVYLCMCVFIIVAVQYAMQQQYKKSLITMYVPDKVGNSFAASADNVRHNTLHKLLTFFRNLQSRKAID